MSSQNILNVNTKLKAYKLIHDPVVLLNLIYSKYGDIEEDFDLLYINQLVYDKSSRYNILFKEFQYWHNDDEYLKRFYKRYESRPRLPKLSEYYKNYHLFFCRPNFTDIIISDLMEDYGDDKAEIFYKNNFEKTDSMDEEKEQSEKRTSESLSSLDNITDNKIIFTKKAKKIIDQNLESNMGTLTLTTNSINFNNVNNNEMNNNEGLISKRSANDSFEKIVHNLIHYKKNKIKLEKNKKPELNKPSKKNLYSGKKITCKVGGTYASKKINKNIINALNNNTSKKKLMHHIKGKNSLFSLLKSNNVINYVKTDNNNLIEKQNNITFGINSNKLCSRSKNNFSNIFCSPKNKEHNYHLISKLEEFHTNVIRPNTSFHHKRNKTMYFNRNQMTGLTNNPLSTLNTNSNNYINTISSIISKNNINHNNSRNYIDNLKSLNYKQTSQFNNFLTINSNIIKNQKGFKDAKNRLKNKTFEAENKNNVNNKISTLKENFKIHHKNKKIHHININDKEVNNQNLMKKNNLGIASGSKFNLMKNQINPNNYKVSITKITKNNIKYFSPKFSPINCFNKNVMNNNNHKKTGLHKKCQTTILSNVIETSPKNQVSSPMSLIKQQKKLYNINKSESVTSKIKTKITKNKINNLNINFNNVIFNAPLSNISENINFNNNFSNNSNENLSYKLSTPTNNRLNFSNTISMNNNNIIPNNSHQINNNLNIKEAQSQKMNYITNLKNFCNFSRNKTSLYGRSFSQTDDNYSLINHNNNMTTNSKIIYDKNRVINHTYSNLISNEKHDGFKKKRSELIIPKPNSKKINLKNPKKKSNQIKKGKKKIEGRNKQVENGFKQFGITEISKGTEVIRRINDSFRNKENSKNLNISNNLYSSPNTTGRIFTIQPINVNRNINLITKKVSKTKQKIKMK